MFFFFNDTATTEIYTLSLHDALPIYPPPHAHATHRASGQLSPACPRIAALSHREPANSRRRQPHTTAHPHQSTGTRGARSEEHTSELQSRQYLVCRLLLEKKKKSLTL